MWQRGFLGYRLLDDLGNFAALTADEDAVFGVVDAYALEVKIFGGSFGVFGCDVLNTGTCT